MAYILGVDIGTSGTKTVLFSEDGTPVASATYEYPLYTPQNGYAEQEPLDWWNASVNGIKDVISQSNVSADDIKGVGLSGQSVSQSSGAISVLRRKSLRSPIKSAQTE